MPGYITLDSLSFSTPDGRRLLYNLTLAFGAERTGLVGRNGVGKTTLLRLIAGELSPSAGSLSVSGALGMLRQSPAPSPDATVADILGVAEGLARLERIARGEGDDDDLAEADWLLEARIDSALVEVGLAGLDLKRAASTLSGGQVTRAGLAGVLASDPDVMILDEPTNNLDAAARALIGSVLERWKKGAIVVSHDRDLLRGMDRIVELTSLGARVYGGGYDLYEARHAEEAAAAEQDVANAERDLARVEREAQAARERQARRDAAGRRFAARRSEPKILLGAQAERAENSGGRGDLLAGRRRDAAVKGLDAATSRVERLRRLDFELPSSGLASGRTVLAFEAVSFAYPGGDELFRDVSLKMTGPERIAITGPNGVGKSSLLALADGRLTPVRGRVVRGVRAAFLDQKTALLGEDETLLEAFRRLNPEATDNAAYAALAQFLFRNVAARKPIAALSGGERLRAGLACVLMAQTPPQLLILDEPTNHLDLESIAAIEAAVSGYDGALLVVSHDPDFLDAVGIDREIRLG